MITSLSILLINFITSSILSILILSLVLYPLLLCISISFTLFLLRISLYCCNQSYYLLNLFVYKSILKALREDGLSLKPIIVSNVSYGFPLIDNIISPGLRRANRHVLMACVPDIN